MKDYSVNWDPSGVYPEITREYLGILPEFFIHATQEGDTLEQVTQAMDKYTNMPVSQWSRYRINISRMSAWSKTNK